MAFGRSLEGLDLYYKAINTMKMLKLTHHPYFNTFIEKLKFHAFRTLNEPLRKIEIAIKTKALIDELFADSN